MNVGKYAGLISAALIAAVVAAGCSTGNSIADDAICNVRGTDIPIKGEVRSYDSYISNTLDAYKAQGQTPPKEGSQEYETLSKGTVDVLIRQELFEQEAEGHPDGLRNRR